MPYKVLLIVEFSQIIVIIIIIIIVIIIIIIIIKYAANQQVQGLNQSSACVVVCRPTVHHYQYRKVAT